jgi:trehalose 6-phosphate synthase
MRACGGTWVAHGSGSADRETVDATTACGPAGRGATRCAASGSPRGGERGYYYGFSNEGLWPLCHIATRARPSARGLAQHYER